MALEADAQGMGRRHAKFHRLWQSFVSTGVRRHHPMAAPANKRPVPDFFPDLKRKTARMKFFLWPPLLNKSARAKPLAAIWAR